MLAQIASMITMRAKTNLVFYRVGAGRITVLHILNGAIDVEAILFPGG
jgi:hypothetical protein